MAAVATMQKLMTAEQLAEHFGVETETVYRWAREQRIPSVRVTHKVVRFDLAEVREALSKANDR